MEREGLIRRFRHTFELAWKTLKDRNAMAHEFDCAVFKTVAANIHGRYLHLFETLWTRLAEEETES